MTNGFDPTDEEIMQEVVKNLSAEQLQSVGKAMGDVMSKNINTLVFSAIYEYFVKKEMYKIGLIKADEYYKYLRESDSLCSTLGELNVKNFGLGKEQKDE